MDGWILVLAITPLLAAMAGCGDAPPREPSVYETSIARWHGERLERLRAEDGWLSLVGLHWLEEGDNGVGRGDGRAVAYGGFPHEDVGVIALRDGVLTFTPAAGVDAATQVLASDADGAPTVLEIGSCRMHVIRRGDRFAVRLKDLDAPLRRSFRGIERYPVDEGWRIEARYEAPAPDSRVAVDSIIGVVSEQDLAGWAAFERDGVACRMVLLDGGEPDRYFVVFGDETNAVETHGAGRFVEAVRRGDDLVEIDFNRAYNPPCAFTDYATCPLPVDANILPFAVRAGERAWKPQG
jgi:uncharacterized protein (DUF1684 family)